jgi:hypothetical protein
MHLQGKHVLLVVAIASCFSFAQRPGIIEHTRGRMIKVENALIITWQGYSSEANANQVEIFDLEGHPVAALQVLWAVQEEAGWYL